MKKSTWKLWILVAVAFLFVAITNIMSKNYVFGTIYISLAITYGLLSYSYYRKNQNPIEIADGDLETMDNELYKLIANGKSIAAVKLCREVTGWGLKEAKDHVDELTENQE